MNDREFIELLNLYVDREISPQDALRLEAEVAASGERRRVYDQYCRMQKACSMLATQPSESGADQAQRRVVAFPAPRAWRLGPMAAGLAAAACVIAVVGLRERGALATGGSPAAAVFSESPRTVPDTMDLPPAPDPMKSVFYARAPAGPAGGSAPRPMFAMAYESSQLAPFNWIGDIHLAPVFSSANPDFLLAHKQDLKAAISDEPQGPRIPQEPVEMAAFRFQR